MKSAVRPKTTESQHIGTPRPGSTRFCPTLRLGDTKPRCVDLQDQTFSPDVLFEPHSNYRVGKLLLLSRASASSTFRQGFDTFRNGFETSTSKQKFRISTYFDERIIPSGTRLATPRSMQPVTGNSPLEVIFDYFCSKQQPGTGVVFLLFSVLCGAFKLNMSVSGQ